MKNIAIWIVLLFSAALPAAASSDEPQYMAIFVDGAKVGYGIHTRIIEKNRVNTVLEMTMVLGRGATSIESTVKQTVKETSSGQPLGFDYFQRIGQLEMTRTATISKGQLTVVTNVSGQKTRQTLVWPKGALLEEGVRLAMLKHQAQDKPVFSILCFLPEGLTAAKSDITIGGKAPVDMLGRQLELVEVRQNMTVEGQQITMTAYMDEEFKTYKMLSPMMGMMLEMVDCSKEFALRQEGVVDFISKLTVALPQPPAKEAFASPVIYELSATCEQPLSLPTTDVQHVETPAANKLLVSVVPLKPAAGQTFPYRGKDPALLECLKPTEYLQCDQKAVVDLAKHAVGSITDAAQAVRQIESFVSGYITSKDLSVGYASAAEVAKYRQGDCSEHAVLSAAMCRAVGIPARVICGLVYADSFVSKKNVFVGHMWAEARVGQQWIPLDATRAASGFSSGYIAVAIGDGKPTDFLGMVNTFGCFKIDKMTVVPAAEQITK